MSSGKIIAGIEDVIVAYLTFLIFFWVGILSYFFQTGNLGKFRAISLTLVAEYMHQNFGMYLRWRFKLSSEGLKIQDSRDVLAKVSCLFIAEGGNL